MYRPHYLAFFFITLEEVGVLRGVTAVENDLPRVEDEASGVLLCFKDASRCDPAGENFTASLADLLIGVFDIRPFV